MGNHTITFHFSKPETSITWSALSWLACQYLHWASTSWMHLVINHVLQSLIKSGTQENHYLHLLASEAVVHHLVASQLVSEAVQLSWDRLNCIFWLRVLERCSIALMTFQGSHFGWKTLNQVTNCHSRRNSVRIDDEIWDYSFLSEGHIFLMISHSNGTFLAMSRSKLISNLRDSNWSHFDFGEGLTLIVNSNNNWVNFAILWVL